MAKARKDPIALNDIEEFVNESSDFDFELKVVEKLARLGFECQHSGLYDDPVTGKGRQFDIQARYPVENRRVLMSLECKNIRENSPLLVSCVPRAESENFHEIILSVAEKEEKGPNGTRLPHLTFEKTARRRVSDSELYPSNKRVAKSVDQVARSASGEFIKTNSDVHDKVSQAIHSAYSLVKESATHYVRENHHMHFVLPVLVLPDDRLWEVTYNSDGTRHGKIQRVSHASYWVNRHWVVDAVLGEIGYQITHLEIVTFSNLHDFIVSWLDKQNNFNAVFPEGADIMLWNNKYRL